MIKLLLVDDVKANLLALEQLVEAPDRQLVRATSGDEALEILYQEHDFAVILMDVQMPGIDGFETVRLLRSKDNCKDIPVIFITAFDKQGDMEVEAYAHGAVDYVMKPIQSQVLISKVDVFVDLYRTRQSLIRSNEKLEESNRKLTRAMALKSEFLANMSHELRTPMNSIIGFTGRVLKKAGDSLSDRHIKNLKTVERNAHHLLSLINSLLDLSKIEADKMDVFTERFMLADLLHDVIDLTGSLVANKNISIRVDVADESISIVTDKTKVKQILINLVSNAVKFTEKGGITLKARVMNDDSVKIEVIDTGMGMEADALNYIFEAFRQVDGGNTRMQGGTGLGLNITSRFCEMLGGDVNVESKPGIGSTFIVTLPLHYSSNSVSITDEANGPSDVGATDTAFSQMVVGEGPKILCIDDHAEVLELLAEYLSEAGYQAICVNNGAEGVIKARELQPLAITLDVQMPHQDGWSVLKELKDDPATRDIPVLMATMMGNNALGYELGAYGFLEKPIMPDNLIRCIGSVPIRVRHVLVVDDDEGVRDLMQQALEDHGILSTLAVDGVHALEMLNGMGEDLPDMIILDLMMPRMDGFEVLTRLAEDDAWSSIPVLVSTAKDLSAEEKLLLAAQAKGVVQKGGDNLENIIASIQEKKTINSEKILT